MDNQVIERLRKDHGKRDDPDGYVCYRCLYIPAGDVDPDYVPWPCDAALLLLEIAYLDCELAREQGIHRQPCRGCWADLGVILPSA